MIDKQNPKSDYILCTIYKLQFSLDFFQPVKVNGAMMIQENLVKMTIVINHSKFNL